MRADRLIRIMILLQRHTKMTTKELASKLNVSERTIQRDMDALTLSGIPVVAERGKAGGWRLMDHFRSRLNGLKLQDLKALLILPSEKILEDLGVQIDGPSFRDHLLASLPSVMQSEGKKYLEKLYVDTSTWKTSTKSELFPTIQQALWEDRKLIITYQKSDGASSERMVCPLGLVTKGSVWYLVAINENAEYRTFRLSRIVKAVDLEESFIRPEQFSLRDYWKKSTLDFVGSLPSYKLEVWVAPAMLRRMTFTDKFISILAVGTEQQDGWIPVTLEANTEQEALNYVLGCGASMKVVEPKQLVEKIIQQAKAVVDMYRID